MYLVIELQKNGNQVANLVTSHENLSAAYSKYHTVLASAAISDIGAHSAILINDRGDMIERKCFEHMAPAAEEEEN